jgi:pyruvate carboxylase subunit B
VTPFSQYVKNTALMNLMNLLKGQPRWTTIDKDTWNMILGRMGQLPGPLDPEIIALAKQKGLEFYTGNPQNEFPDELDRFRAEMKENGWDFGQDDEELFEFAMHERQYRDYKSGVAKDRFNKDLEAARAKAGAPIIITRPVIEVPKVDIEAIQRQYPDAIPVQAPVKGQMLWGIDVDDASSAPVVGTAVSADEPMGFIQTYYGMEEILPLSDGRIAVTLAKQGENVAKGEIVAFIQK